MYGFIHRKRQRFFQASFRYASYKRRLPEFNVAHEETVEMSQVHSVSSFNESRPPSTFSIFRGTFEESLFSRSPIEHLSGFLPRIPDWEVFLLSPVEASLDPDDQGSEVPESTPLVVPREILLLGYSISQDFVPVLQQSPRTGFCCKTGTKSLY